MPMPKVEIQEEDLRKLYLEEGLSLQKIGKKLGCSPQTVLNRMEEYGIERRGRADWKIKEIPDKRAVLSYLLGIYLGDGWTSFKEWKDRNGWRKTRYTFGLKAKSDRFLGSFRKALEKLGLNVYNVEEDGYACDSKRLLELFRGLESDFDGLKRFIVGHEREFLKGLYESDGTEPEQTDRVSAGIFTCDDEIAELSKELIEEMGYQASIHEGGGPKGWEEKCVAVIGGNRVCYDFLKEIDPVIRNVEGINREDLPEHKHKPTQEKVEV